MAERGQSKKRTIRGVLELDELEGEEAPELNAELLTADGRRTPLEVDAKGGFAVPAEVEGTRAIIEIGSQDARRRFAVDSVVSELNQLGTWRIPRVDWSKWLVFRRCVTGRVQVCRPTWWPPIPPYIVPLPPKPWTLDALALTAIDDVRSPLPQPSAELELLYPAPFWCEPVCEARVEVILRTTCCRLVIQPEPVIRDLCRLIDCEFPIPWPDPIPDPWPDPFLRIDEAVSRRVRRAIGESSRPDIEAITEAGEHLKVLTRIPRPDQIEYIRAHPILVDRYCTTTEKVVATVPVQPDGTFTACFSMHPFLLPFGCTYQVVYRVTQLQDGEWVEIYDGPARHESFDLDDAAVLRASWWADSCDGPGPQPDVDRPFVLFERVGSTWADNFIQSTTQNGELSFTGPLGATDGLVNPPPSPNPSASAGPYDQPWAQTLEMRLQFHPGMAAPAVGAKYFRVRVVRLDGNGQPVGTVRTLNNAISWRKYFAPAPGQVGIRPVTLNAAPVNGVNGLYEIPYPDLSFPWLGGQFHIRLDTTGLADDRHSVVVDVYDQAGVRLVPDSSPPPGAGTTDVARPFDFRRIDGPISGPTVPTSVVPQHTVAALFWVDNVPCTGDIEAIHHNSTASSANCQFLEGPATDTVAVQYSAQHVNGFQWYHNLTRKQGLTGPTVNLRVPPPAGAIAQSANVAGGLTGADTFGSALGTHMKCSFAANLRVRARHTNGSARISGFDAYDQAAFALERTT